jgi:hypothetical protein
MKITRFPLWAIAPIAQIPTSILKAGVPSALLTMLMATAAAMYAQPTTYTYIGQRLTVAPLSFIYVNGVLTPIVGAWASGGTPTQITASMTFSSPLPPNLNWVSVPFPIAWSMSDGLHAANQSSPGCIGCEGLLTLSTDANGNITYWAFRTFFNITIGSAQYTEDMQTAYYPPGQVEAIPFVADNSAEYSQPSGAVDAEAENSSGVNPNALPGQWVAVTAPYIYTYTGKSMTGCPLPCTLSATLAFAAALPSSNNNAYSVFIPTAFTMTDGITTLTPANSIILFETIAISPTGVPSQWFVEAYQPTYGLYGMLSWYVLPPTPDYQTRDQTNFSLAPVVANGPMYEGTNAFDPGAWAAYATIPSGNVATTASGLVYSRAAQTFNGTVTVRNMGGSTISGPLLILFTGNPAGVTLVNATGSLPGTPYITAPNPAGLAPGQSVTVSVQFNNPSNLKISVTPVIYPGSM